MIKLRSNSRVLDNVPNKIEYLKWDLFDDRINSGYFEKDGQEFLYLDNIFILPKSLEAKDIVSDTLDLSNWELTKVSDEPDPHYINNFFNNRGEHNCWKFEDSKLEGSWLLKDRDTGDTIDFSLKLRKDLMYDWDSLGCSYDYSVCFPERACVPYKEAMVTRKSDFIMFLLWKMKLSEA